MKGLTHAEIEAFRTTGCVTVPDAVSAEHLAAMRAAVASWVEESRRHTGPFGRMADGRPRFDVDDDHCAEHPSLRRVAAPTDLAPVFLDVLTQGRLPRMVADLIGPDLRLHHCKINSKLPGTRTQVKWHQDFCFDPHSNDDQVTALVFLDDMDEVNGALRVVPGSHTGPLYSHWQGGRFTGAVDESVAAAFERDAVMQTGAAGSACLMHVRLAHASPANRSSRARTLFIACIAAADAVPLAPNAVPGHHSGMLLHGREPGRIRGTAFEVECPRVPQGASFFDQQADAGPGAGTGGR